jgi:hypothetical protein
MSLEKSTNNLPIYFVGALITSAVGGILLLALDFGGWNGSNYYLGVYIYGGIDAWNSVYSIPIAISGFLLLYCTFISIQVLRSPEKKQDIKYLNYAFYATFLVLILSILEGLIFGITLELDDAWWWFDAGFYGGIIGSLLTAILLYLGIKNQEPNYNPFSKLTKKYAN